MIVTDQFLPMKKCVENNVEFLCIGAGLPRTGTTSTFIALEQLLPGKCLHMVRSVTESKIHAPFWAKASKGELTDEDFKQFIESERLSAAVEFLWWKDLSRLYPNAKVLLTVKDPVKWYNSVKNSIRNTVGFANTLIALPLRALSWLMGVSMQPATFSFCVGTYLGARYPGGIFGVVDSGEDTAVRFFNAWKADVIKEVAADRLLIYDVAEGWDPLCKFLGLPKPDRPFPRANKTQHHHEEMRRWKVLCFIVWSVVVVWVGTALYVVQDRLQRICVSVNVL